MSEIRKGLPAFLAMVLAFAGGERVVAGDGAVLSRLRVTLSQAQTGLAEGRYDEAGTLFRQAIDDAAGLRDPNLPLARAVDGLADVQRHLGRLDEAAELYRRSSRMWEALLGGRQPRLATTLHNLALVYVAQGRPERATTELRRALAIWEATLGGESPQAANTRRALRRLTPEPDTGRPDQEPNSATGRRTVSSPR